MNLYVRHITGWFRAAGLTLFLSCPALMITTVAGQDSLQVTGTITGFSGRPLEGVAVSIEGVYAAPVITDANGYFELTSPAGDVWLLINPVEQYKSRRIYLNRRGNLNIRLTPVDMVSGYDEVGSLFGTELRKNFISAYHSPDPDKALYYPNQSIDHYFQSTIPGLWATVQSGMPSAGATTYLRGVHSMSTTSQPLYIVDGLPLEDVGLFQSKLSGYTYSPVSSLDPMDITNITVLKDYLGSAIYGLRGSNGVILIETLKPTALKTTIDFSYRTGVSLQPDKIPQLNSDQYKTLANEVLMTSGLYEEDYTEDYFPLYVTGSDPEYYKYNKNTNWQNEVFRNALMNDMYIRVRGGDEIAMYGLSVSYLKHEGIIKKTDASRFNVRFVGSFNIFQWLRMYISSNLNSNQSNIRESALSPKTSPIYTALAKAPILNPYKFDELGKELKTIEEVNSLGISNPVAVINKFEGRNRHYRFATSFKVEADIWQDHLKWTSMLGINFNSLNENVFMPNTGMELYYDDEAYNAAKALKNYLFSIYSDHFLSYRQSFMNKHLITAAAGMRLHQNTFEIDWGIAKNAHERDEYKQLQNGVSYLREMGGESAKWNRMGTYASAEYSYRDKYFINGSLVGEFSSRIGKNASDVVKVGEVPFGIFYSTGVAWRLNAEPFLRDIYWLEDLKLRVTYGETGNDDIGNLASLDYYTTDHYRETTAMIPGTITDQSLKFERNKQLNSGLDVSLFGNRISVTGNWYRITTEDLLVLEPQPSYLGFTIVPSNNGKITNTGWETGFYSRLVNLEKFRWDIGFNVARFNNTVDAIQDDQVITPFTGGYYISRVGEPVLSFYGYRFLGVYATEEEASLEGLKTEKGIPFGAGDARYEDVSGPEGIPDKVINEFDRVIIGSPIPELFGGISNTFSYGRWSLTANIQVVTGQEAYNYLRNQNEKMTDLSNQSTNTLSRWTQSGQITDVPRALYDDPLGNSAFSTRWIEDGSYIRLKQLTLSYKVPQEIWLLRNLEVFATASNLYTWKKYLGYDPEFSYSYYTMEQGIDYGLMPHTRRFIMGFRVGL